MTDVHTLAVKLRDRAGKGAARQSRRDGYVPGVVYGAKQDPLLINLAPNDLIKELRKTGFYTTLFDLKADSKTERVLPRDVQFDPVTDRPIHVDFLRVSATTRITVNVPVIFQNEAASPGLKVGGVLNIVRHEVALICRADHIPHAIEIDLTGREIGDSIHISAVALPEGATPEIADRDFTIATIAAPSAVRSDAAEAAAAPAAAAPAAAGKAAAPAGGKAAAPAKAPAKK